MCCFFRKVQYSLALALAAFLLLVVPVLASTYTSTIGVTESNGTSYTQLGVTATMDNDYLSTNGFITSTGLDTRVTAGGTAIPHLIVDDQTMFSYPIAGNAVTNFKYTTGNTVLSDYYIIPGYDGYITTTDAAALEMGNEFEVEWDGWIGTASGADKNLVIKEGAFRAYVSAEGEVTATIMAGIENTWTANNQTGLWGASYTRVGQRVNSFNAVVITSVQFYLYKQGSPTGTATVVARKVSDDSIIGTFGTIDVTTLPSGAGAAAWHSFTDEVAIPSQQDIRLLVEYSGGDASNYVGVRSHTADVITGLWTKYLGSYTDTGTEDIKILMYYDTAVSATATGLTSGEYKVTVAADTTNLTIDIDDVEKDSTALSGASVPNNSNDYIWLQNNVVPYTDYITLDVGGAEVVNYNPAAIIIGNTLLDLTGAAQDGTFTWGSNPAGVAVSVGSLVSSDTPVPTVGGEEGAAADTLPDSNIDYTTDTAIDNPLSDLIDPFANVMTGVSSELIWMGIGFVAVIGLMALAGRFTQHVMITAGVGMAVMGLFYSLGVFELWMLLFYGLVAVAVVLYERVPSI